MLETRREQPSRTDVDIAVGVLVLLRRSGAEEAHTELLETAVKNRVSLLSLSRALVALAARRSVPRTTAADVATARWGGLLLPTLPALPILPTLPTLAV